MTRTIALRRGGAVGAVTLCSSCDDAHLTWDALTLTLPRARLLELARMLAEAAEVLESSPARRAAPEAAWTH